MIAQIENNFDSNAPVQQVCRNQLNIHKTSTGKRSLEDFNDEERSLKLLKLQSDIDDKNAATEKKKAAAKAIDRKSEAEAKSIDRKSEAEARAIDRKSETEAQAKLQDIKNKQIETEAKAKAMLMKAEADAEKTRTQAKTSYAEELRKFLHSIQVLEHRATENCAQQELFKQTMAQAYRKLSEFFTQHEANNVQSSETTDAE